MHSLRSFGLSLVRFGGVSVVVLLTLSACAGSAPLGPVSSATPPLSPELRDQRNRIDVNYRLNGPATVSARILAADGQQWLIHDGVPRPRPGDYVFQFDGTVPGPGKNERRVLPSGEYRVQLEAASTGQTQHAEVPLSIRDADTSAPDVTDLALLPDHISPNFDARDDVTHITYRLAKNARVSAFLDRETSPGQFARVWMGEEIKLQAGEQSIVWDGLNSGVPVRTGGYLLGVRARDAAGNVVERSSALVVEESGLPEASIVLTRIGPLRIIRGEQVCVDASIRNTGQTVLRTLGPDPGYTYNSLDTYASIEDHRFAEHAGYWRLGLSWSGGTEVSSATYPYRWGFGRDLEPGGEVSVHGCVRVVNEQDKLVFFAGLVQENIAIHSAGAGLVRIEISS
ncbi:MAG TPA: hypothetical protein VGL99_21125 [Chloroflexota bacterium]|jgi:hypothetical protein